MFQSFKNAFLGSSAMLVVSLGDSLFLELPKLNQVFSPNTDTI